VTDSTLDGVLNFDRLADGSLVAKAGALGCVSEDGSGGDCADGRALSGASDVSISPGSDNIYVSAIDGDAVAVLDRAASGKLAQQSGIGGCVMVDGASSNCTDARALDGPLRVVISPDGENVYVSSLVSDAISVFDRDQGDGALAQKAGTAGCISADGVGGECAIGRAIGFTFDLEMTEDGRSLYAASRTTSIEGSVAALSRSVDTGLLSQPPGEEGCVSADGSDDCGFARAIDTTSGLSSSPDGTSLYAASFSDSAVAIFDRSPLGPRATFRQVPPASTGSREALFKFSSSVPGATFECRIDSKAFAVCGATARFKKLSRGRHTVAVRAVKNLSPGKASKYSWRVR
jgi:DNA-binding beta-propeller fold protein YncE